MFLGPLHHQDGWTCVKVGNFDNNGGILYRIWWGTQYYGNEFAMTGLRKIIYSYRVVTMDGRQV